MNKHRKPLVSRRRILVHIEKDLIQPLRDYCEMNFTGHSRFVNDAVREKLIREKDLKPRLAPKDDDLA